VIAAVDAVLVFNLRHDDGAAAAQLERQDLLGQAVDPPLSGLKKQRRVGADGLCGFRVGE